MRLYGRDSYGNKIYLPVVADTRSKLAQIYGSEDIQLSDGFFHHVNKIRAESSNKIILPSAVIGTLVGALAGPIGMLIGAGLGGALGGNKDLNEKQKVDIFNDSHYRSKKYVQ